MERCDNRRTKWLSFASHAHVMESARCAQRDRPGTVAAARADEASAEVHWSHRGGEVLDGSEVTNRHLGDVSTPRDDSSMERAGVSVDARVEGSVCSVIHV